MKFRTILPYLLVFGLILGIVTALGGTRALQIFAMIDAGASMPEHEEGVGVHEATEAHWERTLRAVGSVTAVQGITVATNAPGVVTALPFEPGTRVQAGEILLQMDIAVEEADLAAARAEEEFAELNLERARDLHRRQAGSRADLDVADANLKQSRARRASLEAIIQRKTVRAPFDGYLGIRLVNLGQYLGVGAPIVSLQTLDSVFVEFSLPQQSLSLVERGMVIRATTDARPGRVYEGRLTAIDPDIDAATRNVRLQATFENENLDLRPGMFVRVEVVLPEAEPVLAIPSTAVLKAPYGDSVFVVEEREDGASIARQRFVRVGRARGDFVNVTEGVSAGEFVVSSGAFKLRNDVRLRINNEQAPEPQIDPRPPEG